jgi:DNA-binding MarR family transcriptional regulator
LSRQKLRMTSDHCEVDPDPRADELDLSALLSQLLVAFVIEFDNEFEHQMPHRTTRHGRVDGPGPRPWLVSMAMWAHCMRLVPDDGIPAGELVRRSQLTAKSTQALVKRLSEWWGYLKVIADDANAHLAKPRSSWLVRPTAAGRRANEIWAPLTADIEDRWQARFGEDRLADLRRALASVVQGLDVGLPDFLPVGGAKLEQRPATSAERASALALPALLSKVLMALALDFDDDSELSLGIYTSAATSRLAISANVLRVLNREGVRVADVPSLTGVAKMTVDNWLRSLAEHGYLTIASDPAAGRYRLARLTAKGERARDAYLAWTAKVNERLHDGNDNSRARALRTAAERLVAAGDQGSLLYSGIEPYADGWRHDLQPPTMLPHFPVITHRGGYPDGS